MTDQAPEYRDVMIDYTNHRGERRVRCVRPVSIWYGATDHHPRLGWLLAARDIESGEIRYFAMANIHSWVAAEDWPPPNQQPAEVASE